jgi:4-alpha-glucanotransferase
MARSSGVTIPLFSVRTRADWGIGQITDLPACAAWLSRAGMKLVQVLPTQELGGGETSPYGALSAFAIDPIYVAVDGVPDLDEAAVAKALGDDGRAELERVRRAPRVDYRAVRALKRRALGAAFARFGERELAKGSPRARALMEFVEREGAWLRDHALYVALRDAHADHGWASWPEAERDRAPEVLSLAREPRDDGGLGTRVLEQMYAQWIAHVQWAEARAGLARHGVALMGDMPFIVGAESADVWARRGEFLRDVSLGAPPDDFAPEGQSWGLPAYDWDAMDATGLAWLRARARHAAALFDRFRIDHLVGFFRQWVKKEGDKGRFVPADEASQRARGEAVLRAMIAEAGPGAVVAEDLGVIPPFVRETIARLGVPGYKVLPWERDGQFMPHDPASYPALSVATWSTHDTAPITAWWDDLQHWERERLAALRGIPLDLPPAERDLRLFELLFSASSELTLTLVNELLGDRARINTPGTVNADNWTWRLPRPIEELADDPALGARFDAIRARVEASGR